MTDAHAGGAAPALSGTGLAATAYARLVALFADGGHRPSTEQWDAIADLLVHLERVADWKVQDAVYVSPIPAGTGKSTSVAAFASALCDAPDYDHTGMLILCNRVSEARDMAEKLAAYRDKLCIIVAAKHTDTLAMADHTEADQAQIVVATQASLKATLRGAADFPSATRFHYRGARRAVVCWDEAIAFSRPVVLDGFVLAGLAKAMSRQSTEAAGELLSWAGGIAKTPTAGLCQVPDFAALGVDLPELENDVSDNDALIAEAKALAAISGGQGYVMRDTPTSSAMVSCIPELPASLLPVTVTDASAARGVHHESYRQMATKRRVVYLKEASKTYRNLTIRVVPTAASRSVYRDKKTTKGLELTEMAVRYIRSVAPEDVLIVSYKGPFSIKGVRERTIADAINARLAEEERKRVRHLTYGNHTATNDHKHVRHVMLMGLNFLPRAATYAASGAAQDKAMRTEDAADHPTEKQVDDMRTGMLRDATLQALLRGAARMGVEGDCGVMEAVIPQARQTGLSEEDLLGMFPGAVVRTDTSLLPQRPLKGKLKALSEGVLELLSVGLPAIPYPVLYAKLGVARPNGVRLIKRPEWKAWVDAMGLTQVRLPGGVVGLTA